MISYKILSAEDINRSLFNSFIRRQTVVKCWRKEQGSWIIKDAPFTDDWSETDYQQLIAHLKSLLCSGGFVCGAFYQGALKGFVSVDAQWFGGYGEYLDLTNLHVSEDMRRLGIGRTLFLAAAECAGKQGAKKLYLSAHSAVETQAFYRSVGCAEAERYSKKHAEEEPYDCQMEYVL